ncbi:iron dicitrate transport regulator FecR, partial [Burkholderia multivorans]
TLDWSAAVDALAGVERMIVIGRGLGLDAGRFLQLQRGFLRDREAEAFSSAEVRHGPMELIDRDYPLLVFAPPGPEQAGLL